MHHFSSDMQKKKRNVLKELDVFLGSPQEPANADSNANFADAL